MSLSSCLTIDLIRELNEPVQFGKYPLGIHLLEEELELRNPYFPLEYDATGQIITSEVMGYTEEGEEIWS